MRCSDCSKPVRPVVSVDIDGTLADWHFSFFSFVAHYYDMMQTEFEGLLGYSGGIPINQWLGVSIDEYRKLKLAHRQGGFKRWMPPMEGAQEFVRKVRDLDVELWICTTRPYNRLDNLDPDTQHWLERNGIEYDHLLYDDDKYTELTNAVDPERISIVWEDELEQCQRARSLMLPVWQRGQRYNRNSRWTWRCDGLETAYEYTAAQVDNWRKEHG